MYVGVYVCMYVCKYVYMSICLYVYMSICICVYVYICIYVYTYICTYVYMYICIYVFMYIYICIYAYMYTCTCMCTYNMCVYIYVYTCTRVVAFYLWCRVTLASQTQLQDVGCHCYWALESLEVAMRFQADTCSWGFRVQEFRFKMVWVSMASGRRTMGALNNLRQSRGLSNNIAN